MIKFGANIKARKQATPAEISKVRKELLKVYRIGRRSLKRYNGRMGYGCQATEAKKFGLSEEYLRKARVFADAKRGYTLKQLKYLCQTMRSEQAVIGIPMLLHLLPLTKRHRKTIQSEALKNRWSNQQLIVEIRSRFRKIDNRGRTFAVPEDATLALQTLLRLSEKWLKFYRQLAAQEKTEGTTSVLAKLTQDARLAVAAAAITEAIKRLKLGFPTQRS